MFKLTTQKATKTLFDHLTKKGPAEQTKIGKTSDSSEMLHNCKSGGIVWQTHNPVIQLGCGLRAAARIIRAACAGVVACKSPCQIDMPETSRHTQCNLYLCKRQDLTVTFIFPSSYKTLLAAFVFMSGATCAAAQEESAGPDALSETYRDWVLVCRTAAAQDDTPGVRSCEMSQELRQQSDNQRIISVVLQPAQDAGAGALTLITPFGLMVSENVVLDVDGADTLEIPFQTCLPAGCIVQTQIDQAALAVLQQGVTANVKLPTLSGEALSIGISLLGFGAAWTRLNAL